MHYETQVRHFCSKMGFSKYGVARVEPVQRSEAERGFQIFRVERVRLGKKSLGLLNLSARP